MEGRIPFDIKYRPEIEAGKYLVVTREEYSVRIICWEYDIYTPIIAKVEGRTFAKFYQANGRLGGLPEGEHSLDLFLIPNPDYKEPTTTCSTSVDWDAFRREAAKDFVAAHFANPNCNSLATDSITTDSIIKNCITAADELIKQLKAGKK